MKSFKHLITAFSLLLLFVSKSLTSFGQFNVVDNGNANELANAIIGSGVSISNVSIRGGELATGIFTNGLAANIGLEQGIILTSGSSLDAIGPNDSEAITFNQGPEFDGEVDLQSLVDGSIQDACVLEFDFVATSNLISLQYVFGSEEYNEYVCSTFDDVFGFFVTGPNPSGGSYSARNFALIPGTSLPVAVNTINNGLIGNFGQQSGCVSLDYSGYYNDNASSAQLQYDGFTIVLTAEVPVIPGQTYHFKFAIADVSDSNLDSGVFIRAQSFSIFNCQAGNVLFAEDSALEFCTADTIQDIARVRSNSSASNDSYTFVLADSSGEIIAVSDSGVFDLSGLDAGNYGVYGISYQGSPSGIDLGQQIGDVQAGENGCVDVSLPLPIVIETCIPFTLTCPGDIEVECGADLNDFDLVGSPIISFDNESGLSVAFTFSDVVISTSSCVQVIARTWTAAFNGESLSCTQIITVRDTQGPVMNGYQPSITVQCQEDRPSFAAVTANDVCSGQEAVTMWQSHTGRANQICNVTTAFGPGADWAIWLPDLSASGKTASANWVFDSVGGKFEQYVDGTARLYGRIVNAGNPAQVFVVDFWFRNRADFASWSTMGRNYKNDLGLACAAQNVINWDFYEMVDGISTLAGDDALEGDILYMNHMPANYYFGFQVGVGANNKNCNSGISGWFTYEGFCDGEAIEGHGDVNADTQCGPAPEVECDNNDNYTYIYSAMDNCGNCTIAKSMIVIDDTTAPIFVNCPQNITQECSNPIPTVATGLTAVDNCVGNVVVNYVGEVTEYYNAQNQPCPAIDACTTKIIRTWEAIDECGNRGECVQVIELIDTTAPVFNTYNHYISVECDAAAQNFVTASDNCDQNVVITYTEVLQSGGCMGVLARTYTATDNCGNTAQTVQYIALLDTTLPTFVGVPNDTTVQCDQVGTYGPAGVTGDDNCGQDVTITYNEQIVPTNDNCPQSYDIVRTWTATDYCDNVATIVRYVRVIDTTNPVFTSFPQDITISCTDPIPAVVYPIAADNCTNNVTVTLAVSQVAGTCPQSYDILRVFTGEDNCGNQVTQIQTIRVRDTAAPTLSPANQIDSYIYQCSTTIPVIQPTAVDNCSPTNTIVYTYVDTLNTGNSCSRTFQRKWTIKDQCNNKSFFFQTINVVDTAAPVITGSFDITRPCDDIAGIYVTATDNCNNITWDFTDIHVSGGCAGTVIRRYYASDICGNVSAMFEQTIHLTDNIAPVAVATPNFTIDCDDETPVVPAPTWSDNCDDNVSVEYAYSEEAVDTTDDCPDYDRVYTWTATDNCGNSTVAVTRVHVVDNTAPVFVTFPANVTVTCGGTIPPVSYPVIEDNCDLYPDLEMIEDTVGSGCYHTFTIERRFKIWDHCMNERRDTQFVYVVNDLVQPVIVGDLSIDRPCNNFGGIYVSVQNAACNIVTWEFWDENVSGSCGGNVIRYYTATNACGVESAEFIQIIHLIDNVAPVFSNIPVNSSYDCTFAGDIVIGNPTVSDNCDDDVEVTLDIDTIAGDCPAETVYRRTWTAEDNCGNITTVVRNINIVDNAGPVFTAGQQTLYSFFCGENPVTPTPTATDACSAVDTIFATNGPSSGCTGGFSRTWTALDACGNLRTFIQTIAFVDTLAPTFNNCPDDLVLSCDFFTLPVQNGPEAIDGCSDDVTLEFDEFYVGDAPPNGAVMGGYCSMQTPTRPGDNPCGYPVDWGLALHTMPIQYRYYTIDHGQWTRFDDRVEVSIHVAVAQLPGQSPLNAGWDVEMTFDNGSSAADWFNGVHGFKADCGGIDANANEWEYFILQSGATMTGWGAFEGSALSLEHAPINEYFGYQLGTGANNYNADEDGFGGWFGYSGAFRANANADFINVYGAGDVCCTLNCCPQYEVHRQWTATDCSGNSAVCEQVISWSDSVNTVAISECSVLLDGYGRTYSYDLNTGFAQQIVLNESFDSQDIAHYWDAENQIGYIWLYKNSLRVIRQWQITSLNPLIIDSTFVDIAYPDGLIGIGNGLGCITPTKLIAARSGNPATIIEMDLSTNPFTYIPIMDLPLFSIITGDLLVTTDNKILYSVTQFGQQPSVRKFIYQNDYPIPGNEIVVEYTGISGGAIGLFQNNEEIYLAFVDRIYNIQREFPYALELIDSLDILALGASQTPQCLNVSLIPHNNEGVQGEETSYFRGGITVLPNPAIHQTQFAFRAGETASARIELFDFTGKRVAEVFSGAVEEGKQYNIDFNVNSLATGIYTYRFTNGEQIVVERLIIAK